MTGTTFVALMLQKILGNICFSQELGGPVPSLPPPHPNAVTLGCAERLKQLIVSPLGSPWGNKSAPCGVVAVSKGSFLGLLEAVSLDL